jgi:hypothetical protein
MLFLQKIEDDSVDFGLLSEAEMLGDAFAPIFEEINRNYLIEGDFFLLNEGMITDSLNNGATQWSGDVMRYLTIRFQMEQQRPKQGRDLFEWIAAAFRTLINFVLFGLAMLLVLAVIVIAVGHLLLKAWTCIVDTLKKLFDAIWKIIRVRREAEMRDKLLTISEKLDSISDKVSRDPKKMEEIRSFRYEIARMRDYLGAPNPTADAPA